MQVTPERHFFVGMRSARQALAARSADRKDVGTPRIRRSARKRAHSFPGGAAKTWRTLRAHQQRSA